MKTVVILGAADGSLPTYLAARRLGYHTVGVDQNADACAVGLADEFLHVSTREVSRIAAALDGRTDLAGVLAPASDIGLPTAQSLATRFDLPHPPEQVIAASLDKAYFHALCLELGLSSYRMVDGTDPAALFQAASTLRLPVLAKPTDGTGGRGIRVCQPLADLREALPAALATSPTATAVVEEYVTGDHYTLEGFVSAGRLAFFAVTARAITRPPHAVTTYHRLPSGLSPKLEGRFADMVARVCQRLDYQAGPVDVDAVVTARGSIEIIEMGARVGGSGLTDLVRHGTGVDVVAASVDTAVGLSPDLEPERSARPASLTILGADRVGTLTATPGLAELRSMPELVELQVVVPSGARVAPYHQAAAKLGYAVLVADTTEQLNRAEQRMAGMNLFEITPGGDV